MIALALDLTLISLAELKQAARRYTPTAGSGHLTEAIAHGLGAGSNAHLRAELKHRSPQRLRVAGDRFVASLADHGVIVAQSAIYRPAATVALRAAMRAETTLGIHGLGAGRPQRTKSGEIESMAERHARLDGDRRSLENGADGFLHAVALLSGFQPLRTVRPRANSYWLKHVAENLPSTFPDGEELGPIYVSNGQLIAAAIHLGFAYRSCFDELGWETRNAIFNIAAREVENWDRIARPTRYGLADHLSRPLFLPRRGPGAPRDASAP
jgi:hypothetical protein